MSAFDSIKKIKEEYDRVSGELGKKAVIELFDGFFKKHVEVEAIRWPQYTMGFNDGEPTYFAVYEPEVKLKDADDFIETYSIRTEHKELEDDISDLYSNLQEIEEILKSCFGDPMQVTVFNDEARTVETEDYDCGY